ncbi:hypothetical protein Gotur_018766 [Gossypium turneri]
MVAPELAVVFTKLQTLSTSGHASMVSINIFVALLCACIVIGHLLEENRWMNESITALIIGVFTGVIILLTSGGKSSHILVFSEDLFFIYLLPLLYLVKGKNRWTYNTCPMFQVKKRHSFRNFITVMLFGAVGTLVSGTIISLGISNGLMETVYSSVDVLKRSTSIRWNNKRQSGFKSMKKKIEGATDEIRNVVR